MTPDSMRFCGEAYRDWPQNDIMIGPCRLLAALFADGALDDAWTNGDLTSWPGCCIYWHQARDLWLKTAGTSVWLCVLGEWRKGRLN